MAKQKFLQATFVGSLGGVTATQTKGQNIIKQKKWAKCHNGVLSNTCCRAFESLHRICTKVAPLLGSTVLEKTPSSSRIPKLESLWKEWISSHNFVPNNISQINHRDLPFKIENLSYNEFSTTLTFDITSTAVLHPKESCIMLFFIHNEVGQTFAVHFYPYRDTPISIQLPGTVEHQLYLSGMGLDLFHEKWFFASPFSIPAYTWTP